MKTLIAIMALVCAVSAVHAFGLGEGNRFGKLGSMSKGAGTPTPPSSGPGLLVNGTDSALLVDGTDPACLVGGC